MNYIVYKTTNLLNGRFYVGVHNSRSKRYLGSGRLLGAAISKYGRENFKRETLVDCGDDFEEAYSIEAMLVKTVDEDPRSYNLEPGGFGNCNLGSYVVDKKIGIHAASFEQRSNWQKERIANTDPKELFERNSSAGKRCAELGKAGFQTATKEARLEFSRRAQITREERGHTSAFRSKEFQSEMGKRGGKATRGFRTYNDGSERIQIQIIRSFK
jgi:general stress protein YciG